MKHPTSLKYLFLLFALLLTGSAFSQLHDTIVVYEYVHVTDTVWVERETFDYKKLEPIQNATLLLDTTAMNANLLIFSSGKTATIPINRIILSNKHIKNTTMKKAGFFTLFFLAFQSITFAQPELSVKAGVTQFWSKPFDNLSNGLTIGDHQGFELKGKTAVKNLSFSIGYEQHAYGKKINLSLLDSIGTSTLNYKMVESHRSFPILLYYKIKRFELFAGYEYRLVRGDQSSSNSNSGEISSFFNCKNEHALSTGIEYCINDNLSVYSKLYMGDAFIKNNIGSVGYKITNGTSLDLSLKYYINKRTRSLNN